jgi:hypothetical protein
LRVGLSLRIPHSAIKKLLAVSIQLSALKKLPQGGLAVFFSWTLKAICNSAFRILFFMFHSFRTQQSALRT